MFRENVFTSQIENLLIDAVETVKKITTKAKHGCALNSKACVVSSEKTDATRFKGLL